MGIVRLGYFEDFKSNDTLLLEGDHEGLQQLFEAISALASEKADSVAIDTLPFVEAHNGVQLLALTSEKEQRITAQNNAFQWMCTLDGWAGVADKVMALSECDNGHQYFDTPQDEVIIMLSLGEYGPEWWEKHG